jgi:hypothetical protein
MEKTAEEIKAEKDAIELAKNEALKKANESDTATLLKRIEQAEMRARQLENEKLAREKTDEETRRKKLEEDNEFKILYERSESQRVELEKEAERTKKQSSINTEKAAILTNYPSQVIEIANLSGLTLNDDTDEAKSELKTKLDTISAKLGVKPKVVGNNGNISTPTGQEDRAKMLQRMRYSDNKTSSDAKHAVIGSLSVLNEMRKNAGLQPRE